MSSSNQLGQILVQKGYITQQQLDAAVAVQGEQQIGQVLIGWGWVTQEQLMEALDIQTPPPPPPPQQSFLQQQQPVYQQPPVQQPQVTPDLTMDTIEKSKFKMDLKTMLYIGSFLVSGVFYYFTFMGELDARFAALEGSDKDLMVSIDKRLTELENRFTPIGEGVYSVDPKGTWPPTRQEYKMKDEMSRNKIKVLEGDIEELKEDLEKLEEKVNN